MYLFEALINILFETLINELIMFWASRIIYTILYDKMHYWTTAILFPILLFEECFCNRVNRTRVNSPWQGKSKGRDGVFSFDTSFLRKSSLKISLIIYLDSIKSELGAALNERDYSARENERKKWNKVFSIFIVLFENNVTILNKPNVVCSNSP